MFRGRLSSKTPRCHGRRLLTGNPEHTVDEEVIPSQEVEHLCEGDTSRPHVLDLQGEGMHMISPLHSGEHKERNPLNRLPPP
jgi:hypothetical protein